MAMTPRKKLYRADIAEMAGIAIGSLGRANLPPSDGTDIDGGHARPYWWKKTADTWLANRPGKGWRKGAVGGG